MCSVWSRGPPNPRRGGAGSCCPLLGFTTHDGLGILLPAGVAAAKAPAPSDDDNDDDDPDDDHELVLGADDLAVLEAVLGAALPCLAAPAVEP